MRALKILWYAAQLGIIAYVTRLLIPDTHEILAWGAAIGGIVSALGSVGGGALSSSKGGKPPSNPLMSGFDPRADPLLALLTASASAGLGFAPDQNLILAASPLNRMENSLVAGLSGKNNKENLGRLNQMMQAVNAALASGDVTSAESQLNSFFYTMKGKKKKNILTSALTSAGFNDLGSLLSAEQDYRTRSAQYTDMLSQQAAPRAAARTAAEQSINKILTDYPAYGASDLDQAIADAMKPLNAQTLEQANYLGYNPATNVALTQQQGIRDALSILGGRQGLANTALAGLQTELGAQNTAASGASAQAQTSLLQNANLASQQAMALNQIAQQSNLYGASAFGGGVAAGVNQLGSTLSGLGAQPGTQQRQQGGLIQTGPHTWQTPGYTG